MRGYLMRGGLLTYGIEPYLGAFAEHNFHPLLSWRARISLLRDFQPGATIGYGQTHVVNRASRIATLSVGYADGLSRRLSNLGEVLVRGRRCPIVGRVSMDQCQIDVTEIANAITLGDVATLVGGRRRGPNNHSRNGRADQHDAARAHVRAYRACSANVRLIA